MELNKAGCNNAKIRGLLKDNSDLVNRTNQYGYTALAVLLNQRNSSPSSALEDFKSTALLLAEQGAD